MEMKSVAQSYYMLSRAVAPLDTQVTRLGQLDLV